MLGNLTLFAQQMDFQQEVPDAAVFAGLLVVLAVVFIVSLAISVVVLWLVYTCYARIPARHRQLEPWQAFLSLIPVFNLVWNFLVFPRLGKSYKSYFAEQGRTDVGDCGEQVGLWYAICVVLACAPCVQYLAGPAALILLIVFLVKVLTLKGQIPVGAE